MYVSLKGSMSVPLILGIIAVALILYVISVYNSLVRLRTQIQAAIQEIGNQLKRQASLIPNLENSVKGFMKQEKEIFGMLTDARKSVARANESGSVQDIDKAITQLQAVVPQMSIAIEDNPELKSNETVTKFMSELTDTADKLMYARRSVIDLSQRFNEMLMTFPSNLVAQIFSFKPEKGLETPMSGSHVQVTTDDMKDVKVNL